MNLNQSTKCLYLSMALFMLTSVFAHANLPEISSWNPTNVNLDQSATLLLMGNHLTSPLTITIGDTVRTITDNSHPESVTCTIPAMSMPGSITFSVQNTDGIWKSGQLNFVDCSSFTQIDEIVRTKDYTLFINNACFSSYKFQLDTNMMQHVMSSQIDLTDLAEGPHQLTIIGQDDAKNEHSKSILFTVDSIAPSIQLNNIPAKFTANLSETISVTTQEDATYYKYQLDNHSNVEKTISDAIVLSSLSLGTHTLRVFGCDSHHHCQSVSDVSPITWTVIDIAFADHSALSTTLVIAGTQSNVYSTNCMEKDILLEWSVYNDGKQIGETVVGNSFSFTPEKIGSYAGIYTIDMAATYDNQPIKTLNAYIEVPFDIEADRYNITDKAVFSVNGVETGANLVPEIKPNSPGSSNELNIGTWNRTNTESKEITFIPSPSLNALTSFNVWISIEKDPDLNIDNGLNEKTAGPFFIIPIKEYTINLSDESGSISTSTNADITVKELVTLTNQNLTASKSDVRFSLPSSGGTYYFEVKDNRDPPVFMPQTLISSNHDATVILKSVGVYAIEGSVYDKDGNVLDDVTVVAFQPNENKTEQLYKRLPEQYEAKTENSGKYKIYLPEGNAIGGWTVIAGKEEYVTAIKTDQQANTEISFNGDDALHLETRITQVVTENGIIKIQAEPDFKDPGEIDIKIFTDDIEYYAQDHQLIGTTIHLACPTAENYTLIIFADTQDNKDPKTGQYTTHVYRKNSTENVVARNDKTIDSFGGTVSLHHNNLKAKVEIPVIGISETATFALEQIQKTSDCYAITGTQYIYAVHATSITSAKSLRDDQITQVAITIPFDLRTIQPGDIENGVFNVYRADSIEKLENHETELINSIRKSDYLGDGKIGYVTVLVDKLSYFAIGIPPESAPATQRTFIDDDSGGDCFIGILH